MNIMDISKIIVTPDNINYIINSLHTLDNHLINSIIVNQSVPTKDTYILHAYNRIRFNLPNFMIGNITCNEIVQYGLLNWLKFAHEHNYSWNEETCCISARQLNSDCLRYCHENGCLWNENVCLEATIYRSINCVKYAVLNGCPYNIKRCLTALINTNYIELTNSIEFNDILFNNIICDEQELNEELNIDAIY